MQKSVVVQEDNPEEVLNYVNQNRGMLWERIETFKQTLAGFDGAITHKCGEEQSEECKQTYPIKEHLEGGLYTRQMFIPKGHIIISMIHKQQHPSFLLEGKVSYLTDSGELVTIEAPHIIFTQIGTQRVCICTKTPNGVVFIKLMQRLLQKQRLMFIQKTIEHSLRV